MADLYPRTKWIDEDVYRRAVLAIWPTTEEQAEEVLHRDAHDLGIILPVQETSDIDTITSSFSLATISSDNAPESLMSNSTAPTSCDSSLRRPSTSLSQKSSKAAPQLEMPSILTAMERKRQSGFKMGLRKMGFGKKKTMHSNTPSITSMRSHMTNTTTNDSIATAPLDDVVKTDDKLSSSTSKVTRPSTSTCPNSESLAERSECESLLAIRAQQLEEKTRFLKFQTQLLQKLIDERNDLKAKKRADHEHQLAAEEVKVCRLISSHFTTDKYRTRRQSKNWKLVNLKKK